MSVESTMTRLRAANPVRLEQLDTEWLFAEIVSFPGDDRLPDRRSSSARRWRIAVLVALALLLLTGVATATYLLVRGSPRARAHGGLTVIGGPGILARDSAGHVRVVWRCPTSGDCGAVTSVAWAPDGRRLAFTQAELGGRAVGLHILDVTTGSNVEIPVLHTRDPTAARTDAVLQRFVTEELRVLGCTFPTDVAWAPDGVRLAYSCQLQGGRSGIFVIDADGSHRISVRTGLPNALEPTWSPDGRRIAFATAPVTGSGANGTTSQVFVVDLDGTRRTLIARHATAPAWSPNGRTIAYWELGDCGGGIRLATPSGRNVTPLMASGCNAIGSPGMPVWSPDGRKLAIGTTYGVDVVNADGSHDRQVLRENGRGAFGDSRPNWGPNPTGNTVSRHLRPNCPSCN
jgi:Tol biopolymer transport system component